MAIKGGIINSELWENDKRTYSCRQILYILKEAPVEKKFDLISHLYKGGAPYTYSAVAMWVYLIRHFGITDKDVSWDIVESKKRKREQNLRHAAVININDDYDPTKALGRRSNDSLLFENYSEDRHNDILAAICDIDPTVIVTGGKVVRKCLAKFSTIKLVYKKGYASAYLINCIGKPYIIISLPHPNASIKRKLLYKDIIDVLYNLPPTFTLTEANSQ